jgi:hypothetical protein
MSEKSILIVAAVLLAFSSAINMYAAVKLNRAEVAVSSIFCFETK